MLTLAHARDWLCVQLALQGRGARVCHVSCHVFRIVGYCDCNCDAPLPPCHLHLQGSAADYKRSEPDRPPASAPSGAAGGEPELVFHPMQPVHDQDPEMDQFRRQQRLMDDDERVARELAEMEDAKLARSTCTVAVC